MAWESSGRGPSALLPVSNGLEFQAPKFQPGPTLLNSWEVNHKMGDFSLFPPPHLLCISSRSPVFFLLFLSISLWLSVFQMDKQNKFAVRQKRNDMLRKILTGIRYCWRTAFFCLKKKWASKRYNFYSRLNSPKVYTSQGLGLVRIRYQNSIQISQMSSKDPTPQAIKCCFPGCRSTGGWDQKQSQLSNLALEYGIWSCKVVSEALPWMSNSGFLYGQVYL